MDNGIPGWSEDTNISSWSMDTRTPGYKSYTWRISTIFFLKMLVLKHNQYVQNKQFIKVGIKQNNVSTVIWLFKCLIYQWLRSAPSGGSRVVYIFVYITKSVFSLTSNHIFDMHFNHYDAFYSVNKWCAQRFIEFKDKILKPKVEIEDEFILIIYNELISEAVLVFNLQINNSACSVTLAYLDDLWSPEYLDDWQTLASLDIKWSHTCIYVYGLWT